MQVKCETKVIDTATKQLANKHVEGGYYARKRVQPSSPGLSYPLGLVRRVGSVLKKFRTKAEKHPRIFI
jgi:hypothetical protein